MLAKSLYKLAALSYAIAGPARDTRDGRCEPVCQPARSDRCAGLPVLSHHRYSREGYDRRTVGFAPGNRPVPRRGAVCRQAGFGRRCGQRFLELSYRAASVCAVSTDLSDSYCWDHVPYAGPTCGARWPRGEPPFARSTIATGIATGHTVRRIGWCMARPMPFRAAIGEVGVGVFGSILQHLRDPFLALQTDWASFGTPRLWRRLFRRRF